MRYYLNIYPTQWLANQAKNEMKKKLDGYYYRESFDEISIGNRTFYFKGSQLEHNAWYRGYAFSGITGEQYLTCLDVVKQGQYYFLHKRP